MPTNSIQVLKQTELLGRQFTVYGTAENPLFLAKDVAECIDYAKRSNGSYNTTMMLQSVDEEEKVANIVDTLGGNQQVWFLTEDGLYEVLMQSRKPIAKQFKKGVKQILHEVRTTGGYIATHQDDTPEEIMARALTIAQATLSKREERLNSSKPKPSSSKPPSRFRQRKSSKQPRKSATTIIICNRSTRLPPHRWLSKSEWMRRSFTGK
jgi:prophage antirepressor-like protein